MEMYKRIKSIADGGYSLVELVATVGLLMLLTSVIGIASYNTITSKQTREAVRLSTQSAYNKALAAVTVADYNNNNNGDTAENKRKKVAEALAEPAKEAALQGITFDFKPNDEEITKKNLCVIGRIKGDVNGEFTYKIGPDNCESKSVGLPPAEDQTLPSYTEKLEETTMISYMCDGTGTRNARLNISNIDEGTRATLFGDDQSIIPVEFSAASAKNSTIKYRDSKESPDKIENVSDTFELKNGVQYELIVDGQFANIGTLEHGSSGTSLDMTKCMTKISELGKDNGVTEISSYGAVKFSEIEAVKLPPTVTSIRYMFDSAPINDADVSSLNTGNVTDMKGTFYGAGKFNRSLANWETANVTDMSHMFQNAKEYNQAMRISGNKWNTQEVTNMSEMFYGATKFNGVFGSWNVTNLVNMESMFEEADSFNQGLYSWNTNKVENMSRMFYGADSYNQALLKSTNYRWDTSSVKNMESMFENAKAYNNGATYIMDWNTSEVRNMKSMFKNASAFNRPIGHWNVGEVRDMSYMFNNATSYNQNMAEWVSVKTTTMESMFEGATSFNGKVDVWLTDNVRTFKNMFKNAESFNQNLSIGRILPKDPKYKYYLNFSAWPQSWQANKALDWSGMFQGAKMFNNGYAKGSVSDAVFNLNDARVRDVSYMFAGAESFNQYIYGNYSDASNFESMFEGATDFNNGFAKGVADDTNWILMWWNLNNDDGTTKHINTSKMFMNAVSFNAKLGTDDNPNGENLTQWNRVTDSSYMFAGATSFNSHIGDVTTMGNINNMHAMFYQASSFNQDLTNMNTTNVTNMKSMFEGATIFNNGGAAGTRGKPTNWNTANVTDMSYMFAHDAAFNQDLNGSMESVITTQGMFYNASLYNATIKGMENAPKLQTTLVMFLNATSFNSSTSPKWRMPNVTNMERMFRNAKNFNQNINNWNVSKVTNMSGMFHLAQSFNSGIHNWDTTNVTDMSLMFAYASSYDQALVNNEATGGSYKWDTSNVTNMASMFEGATVFNNNNGSSWAFSFNTAKVTDMNNMFRNTKAFNRNLNHLNTANVTNMQSMFFNSNFNNGIATNIGTAPISWNTGKVTDMSYMFAKANYNQNFTGSMANVTTTHGMFEDNTWVRANFSGLSNPNKITDMGWMYKGASQYNISTTPNYYTNNVTRFEHMFDGATVFEQNLSGWNVGNMTHYYNFGRNSKLTAAKLPKGFAASPAGL